MQPVHTLGAVGQVLHPCAHGWQLYELSIQKPVLQTQAGDPMTGVLLGSKQVLHWKEGPASLSLSVMHSKQEGSQEVIWQVPSNKLRFDPDVHFKHTVGFRAGKHS